MPLVSVVMPSYNHGKYIAAAIDSVLTQSFTDYEFLISDDHSLDNTACIIKSYTDPRIKTHFFSENRGAAINHTYLLEQAQGKYIALINSDDLWEKGHLKKQVDVLENDLKYGACFSHAGFIDENGAPIRLNYNIFSQPNRSQSGWLKYFFMNGNCLCHPSSLIRTQIFKELGTYNPSLRQLPDFDMWIRLVKKYPIFIIQEELVKHRRFIHSGQNTSTPTCENSMRDVMEAYYILSHFFDDMTDNLFKEAFSSLFQNRNALFSAEFDCEKFFLYLNKQHYMRPLGMQLAILYFMNLMNTKKNSLDAFINNYNFDLHDFYEISDKIDLAQLMPIKNTCENYVSVHRLKALVLCCLKKSPYLYNYIKKYITI